MKITLFFMVVGMLQLSAKTHTQHITLNKVNAPLSEIFKAIRQQTDYDFVYSKKQLSNAKKVSIHVKNATISEVLAKCFQNQPLSYSVIGKTILLAFRAQSVSPNSVSIPIDIKAKVVNKTGEEISGATVSVNNSSKTTTTGRQGQFELTDLSSGTIITITYIGYQTLSITANESLSVIVLHPSDNKLDEVQVIAYGTSTQRLATGSTGKIDSKDIGKQPVTNPLSALSGRIPGVFVQTTNGLPGGNISVQIRGKGSMIAGTNPLYIIDGVPYDNTAFNKGLLGDNNLAGAISPLNNINPADIASITVLKDADATSIYGSRGSNGVILISTKKASAGVTTFEVNVQQGYNTASAKPAYLGMEEYLNFRKEAFLNTGEVPSNDPESPNYAPDLTLYSQTQATDWSDYIFGNTAKSEQIQMSVSGGQKSTTFSLAGNYHQENTILPGKNDYERAGMAFQLQHRSENNKLSISMSNHFTHQDNDLTNVFQGLSSVGLAPNFPLYMADGSHNWDSYFNIEASSYAKSKTVTDNLISNLSMSYQILPDLSFKINSGYTTINYNQKLTFPTKSLYPGSINYSILGDNTTRSYIIEPQTSYQLHWGPHWMTLLAGATLQNKISENQAIQASNYKLESLMEDLGSAGTIDSRSSTYSSYKYASVFGRLTYNLSNTYIINGTVRRDGSSRFGPDNRYGNFGAIGTAWIFSNYDFLKSKFPILSYGKFRISYGTTGNDQINDYQYLSTYSSPSTNLYQDTQTIRPSRISNANFHWETTVKKDIALDLGFLKDRLLITAEYYLNASRDQLVNYAIPTLTGFSAYQANLPAVIQNNGWELSVNSSNTGNAKLSWSSNFNITLPRNKLKSFSSFSTSSYAKIYEIGYDITRIYGVRSLGIDPVTGAAKYAGQNGEVSATPYQFFTLGKLTPNFYGGLNNTFNFEGFQLDVFIQFVDQKSRGGLTGNLGGTSYNVYQTFRDRWSPSNTDALLPKATLASDGYIANSSINIFDTSYLRLKNVYLSYDFQSTFCKKLKVKSLKVFATAQNLATFWNKKSAVIDPEVGVSGNIPPLKSLVLGIQLAIN